MMTFLDALWIARASPDGQVWFRPCKWRGSGEAYWLREGVMWRGPGGKGGRVSGASRVNDLLGEWETIAPDKVNEERP